MSFRCLSRFSPLHSAAVLRLATIRSFPSLAIMTKRVKVAGNSILSTGSRLGDGIAAIHSAPHVSETFLAPSADQDLSYGQDSGEDMTIEAGGGPRTYPGGVSKWQWKRAQEKKARNIERSKLSQEREQLEANRREQQRAILGPEKPWEEPQPKKVNTSLLVRVPPEVVGRFVKPKAAKDTWNELDGPASPMDVDSLSDRTVKRKVHVPKEASEKHTNGASNSAPFPNPGATKAKAETSVKLPKVDEERKSFMSGVRFDSFGLSPASLQALHEDFQYEDCTIVQASTLPHILQGKDVLAKAKTGTGKTIAFLLPTIESILAVEPSGHLPPAKNPQHTLQPIRAIVICPTRELACQVAEEAKVLVKHHGMGVQIVIGGTRMSAEASRLTRLPCQILVGTPGRLLDHIQTTHGLKQRLQSVQTLILDECDQLLDMGFRKSLDAILAFLPASHQRQTLLFSATLSSQVKGVAMAALKADHVFVDTVGEETSTNVQVKQSVAVVGMDKQLAAIYSLLQDHISAEPEFKVLVFSCTARITQLLAEVFTQLGVPSLQIHSRLSQSKRTKVSDEFRQSPGRVVLFTSDVSARGVDYPDVTLVLQVGAASDKAQYIHRLGRTGRAGKEGQGVLILSPWEDYFLKSVSDLPIEPFSLPPYNAQVEAKVNAALTRVDERSKSLAYASFLGYYKSAKGLKMSSGKLVETANFYSAILGCKKPPSLTRKAVGMMGLKGVPGLNIE